MALHDLRGNARRNLRAGVGVELHFTGHGNFIRLFAAAIAVRGEYLGL